MICDNCIHNAVCEREHFVNHCGYKHTEADVIVPELEKVKAEIENSSIWVQYSIKGHTNKDIEDIVNDVLKQAKQSFIQKLDNHISELKEGAE